MTPEIGFLNRSKVLVDRELEFAAVACDIQMREHFAPAWGFEPWPVVGYADAPAGAYPIAAVDDIDASNTLGFHDDILGAIYGRVLVQDLAGTSITWSHEALEMRLDPTCDQWRDMGDGTQTALEACDAVEGDAYSVSVELFGEKREVMVSNFVLPAFFLPGSQGPWDYMERLTAPLTMTPGGYMIMLKDGVVSSVFAKTSTEMRRGRVLRLGRKLSDRLSRTYRRYAGPA